MSIAYTPQQTAAFDAIKNTKDNLLIKARAGTGKTFTLVKGMALMSGSILALSFNTEITREIAAKIAEAGIRNAKGRTFHSVGVEAVRKVFPNTEIKDNKADVIANELGVPKLLRSVVASLASKAKQRGFVARAESYPADMAVIDLRNREAWMDLVDHFDIELEIADLLAAETNQVAVKELAKNGVSGTEATLRLAINYAAKAIKMSVQMASTMIDFDDMIYLPIALNLNMLKYDWVLVDEAQDTNPLRRMIVRKLMRRNTRVIFVGDDRQAIYGFTGADSDALEIIGKEFNCLPLSLTVTHRCPKAVVDLAKTLVEDYEAAASAPDGIVRDIELGDFAKIDLVPGEDAIICRNTRPLIEIAYGLIRRGITCHVEGKAIGEGLIKLVNRWSTPRTVGALLERLEDHLETKRAKYKEEGKEAAIDALSDRVGTIQAIADTLTLDTPVAMLVEKIELLFKDTKGKDRKSVALMTSHRSKGLEFPRVFLIGENRYMPSPFAHQAHQIVQETNLIYVSYTRAQNELVRVIVPMSDEEFAHDLRMAA